MDKEQKIKNEIERNFGRYYIDPIIEAISKEAFSLYNKGDKIIGYNSYHYLNIASFSLKYSKIKPSSAQFPDKKALNKLSSLTARYSSMQEINMIEEIGALDSLKVLFNKQYWNGSCFDMFRAAIRMYIIAKSIGDEIEECYKIDFDEDLLNSIGLSLDEIYQSFIILFCYFSSDYPIKVNESYINEKFGSYGANAIKFIKYFTIDANNIDKETIYSWICVKLKPFIKINNEIYLSNIYAFHSLLRDSIFWTPKNYLDSTGTKKEFQGKFGHYFEQYVHNLIKYFFGPNKDYKIQEIKDKNTPDFKIETNDYILVIESKAFAKPLSLTIGDTPSIKSGFEKFYDSISKGFKQINSLNIVSSKPRINIVVSFEENTNYSEIENMLNAKYKEKCFVANISDLETLLSIMKNDYILFKQIINRKTKILTENESKDNKDLVLVISEFAKDYDKNEYLREQYYKYGAALKDMLENLMPNIKSTNFLKIISIFE